MEVRWVWVLPLLLGCGRIAFDPGPSDGAPADAAFQLDPIVLEAPGADWARAVARSPGGSYVVVGQIASPHTIASHTIPFVGDRDVVILTFGPSGALDRVQTIASPDFETATGVAIDGDGNLYIVGTVSGAIDFGGGIRTPQRDDMYLASYTAAGAYRWARVVGGDEQGGARDAGFSVALQGSNVIVGGAVAGTVDFGGGATPPSTAYRDGFVASYAAATGDFRWSRRFGDTGYNTVYEVAADEGSIYFSAEFAGTTTLLGTPLTSRGSGDIAIVAVSPDGSLRWVRDFGGAADDTPHSIGVGADGDVFVVGQFRSAIDPGTPLEIVGASDAFVIAYDAAGTFQWGRSLGVSGCARFDTVHQLTDGTIVAGGQFQPAFSLDGVALTSAQNDGLVAGFSPDGELRWADRFGGPEDDAAHGIAGTARGALVVVGGVNGAFDAGCTNRSTGEEQDLYIGAF